VLSTLDTIVNFSVTAACALY